MIRELTENIAGALVAESSRLFLALKVTVICCLISPGCSGSKPNLPAANHSGNSLILLGASLYSVTAIRCVLFCGGRAKVASSVIEAVSVDVVNHSFRIWGHI